MRNAKEASIIVAWEREDQVASNKDKTSKIKEESFETRSRGGEASGLIEEAIEIEGVQTTMVWFLSCFLLFQ